VASDDVRRFYKSGDYHQIIFGEILIAYVTSETPLG